MKKINPNEYIGKSFYRWSVVGFFKDKHGRIALKCVCECGNNGTILPNSLRNGQTKSCGCYRTEELVKRITKHGMTKTKTYRAWVHMFDRCTNRNDAGWKNYGGRGIKICERWNKFEAFLLDMGECPKDMVLDRINNEGNYNKKNCRWTNRKTQNRNVRSNVIIEYKGQKKCAAEWGDITGIDQRVIRARFHSGLPIEKVFSSKKLKSGPKCT